MNEQTEESQAVAIRSGEIETPPTNIIQVTPAQARIESVAAALDTAYKNASTLKLSDTEAASLAEDFPDEAFRTGAGGDDRLIYIEHAYLRQRLNKVLGVGAAVPIRRREWVEDFQYCKDGKNNLGHRVYVDVALLVRGCLVGEAIGDGVYYPNNAKTNYSDALESAKSNAFRRCCKEFGVGLQAWMKGFSEGWMSRQNAPRQSGGYQQAAPPRQMPPKATVEPKKATSEAVLPKEATEATREWMLLNLSRQFNDPDLIAYAEHKKWILPSVEGLSEIPLSFVPTTKEALGEIVRDVEKFLKVVWSGTMSPVDVVIQDELPEEIASVKISVPRAGTKRVEYLANQDTIGSLYASAKAGNDSDRKRLWGLAQEWSPQPYTNPTSGKTYQPTKEDHQTRAGLDAFLEFEESKEKK